MKIIVTDGYVENPGDLSWAPLEALGEVTYYDRIDTADEDESIRRIGDAEIAVINKAKVSRKVIDNCPNPDIRLSKHRSQNGFCIHD